MDESASGVILRVRPLTETSVIVQWLTREQGRIATVARGARRPKSPYAGKLDLFYEEDFSFARSRKSELHTLREVSLRSVHAAIRQDLSRLNAAAYTTVLMEFGTERETPLPEFHALFLEVLEVLDRYPPVSAFMFALELKFLHLLGAAPHAASLSQSAARFVQGAVSVPLSASFELTLPKVLLLEISSFLRRAIGMTLERLPPQRERLIESLPGVA